MYRAILKVTDPWGGDQTVGGEWVLESDQMPIKTGLLDQNGVPLYRISEAQPLGFDLSARRASPRADRGIPSTN